MLDVLVQRRRVKRAARKLTREPRRDQGFPPAVVTAGKKSVAPQGSMAFPGLRNEQQLNDVIAYVKQASGAGQ